MSKHTITAAVLLAGIFFQIQGFAQDAVSSGIHITPAPTGPEDMAHVSWRSFVGKNPAPGKGCFHVSYPNYSWEHLDCQQTPPGFHPRAGAPGVVAEGTAGDYVANSVGLISYAQGVFVTDGVESVASVGGDANEGGSPILGSNEYSLQINTNSNEGTSAACGNQSACTVWQQFMYATDYYGKGNAGLLIQYWRQHWTGPCPKGWTTQHTSNDTATQTSCYQNTAPLFLPDIPIAELGNVTLNANASAGGFDVLILTYRTGESSEAWQVGDEDSPPAGVNIASVWHQAEFNVFGDMEFAEAAFNPGSSITVQLKLNDGSDFGTECLGPGAGSTGETNNLNLGLCQTGLSNIQFTESNPPAPPPPGPSHCPGGITSNCRGISLN